jgi:hypothetical protein
LGFGGLGLGAWGFGAWGFGVLSFVWDSRFGFLDFEV